LFYKLLKYEFNKKEIKFLRFIIIIDSIKTDLKRVYSIIK